MGIFYNPPQPPTANNAGTPPEPHAPIGTQGSQPPRYSTVLMMAAVLASWPADLEPRLQQKNAQQNKIAPLTLTYGQQPPQRAPLAVLNQATILSTWQQTWDAQRAPKSLAWDVPISPYLARTPPPPLIWDAWIPPPPLPARPVQIAPLTLTYGAQPTPQPPLSTLELAQIVGTWAQTWDAQTAPKNAAWNVPPIVSTVVPRTPPPALIWTAWEPLYIAPPRPVNVAPLTLVYGNAPPVRGTSPLQAQIAAAWGEPLFVQAGPKNAGWNVPPLVVAIVPANAFPYQILRAWQEEPFRLPRPVTIAPLTLVYGNSPAPHGPVSPVQMRLLTGAWEPPWHITQLFEHRTGWLFSVIPISPAAISEATVTVQAYVSTVRVEAVISTVTVQGVVSSVTIPSPIYTVIIPAVDGEVEP